jgi:biotin carboxyl carrier protein
MKAPLVLVLLLAVARRVAAQDTSKAKPPAPAPAPAAAPAAAPPPAPAAAPAAVQLEAVLARNVMDRAPQDTGTVFSDSVGTVVLWMRVTGAGGQTLHHVWFHGGDQVGDVALTVGGSPWRTWSRKSIPADAKGAWHVEIRDAAGNVLRRIDFTVGQ